MVFLTVQIFPSLRYGDEEGEDGADDGGNPEDLKGCRKAPLVGTPADEGRNQAADGRRKAQGDAGSKADVFPKVGLS